MKSRRTSKRLCSRRLRFFVTTVYRRIMPLYRSFYFIVYYHGRSDSCDLRPKHRVFRTCRRPITDSPMARARRIVVDRVQPRDGHVTNAVVPLAGRGVRLCVKVGFLELPVNVAVRVFAVKTKTRRVRKA